MGISCENKEQFNEIRSRQFDRWELVAFVDQKNNKKKNNKKNNTEVQPILRLGATDPTGGSPSSKQTEAL